MEEGGQGQGARGEILVTVRPLGLRGSWDVSAPQNSKHSAPKPKRPWSCAGCVEILPTKVTCDVRWCVSCESCELRSARSVRVLRASTSGGRVCRGVVWAWMATSDFCLLSTSVCNARMDQQHTSFACCGCGACVASGDVTHLSDLVWTDDVGHMACEECAAT
jgi:hypothetical protein